MSTAWQTQTKWTMVASSMVNYNIYLDAIGNYNLAVAVNNGAVNSVLGLGQFTSLEAAQIAATNDFNTRATNPLQGFAPTTPGPVATS